MEPDERDGGTGPREPGALAPHEREDAEWERLKAEADAVDIYKYQRRRRVLAAIGIGALGAGLTFLVVTMVDARRNPCERVRAHLCGTAPGSAECKMYEAITRESIEDPSSKLRSNIRAQCQTRIDRMSVDGVKVR